MTLGRTWTVALEGLDGRLVAVEAHLAGGLPGTTIIGMGDTVGQQAKERLRSALVNSGCKWPDQRITLALSPAGLPKKGASFDLAMAVALVVANEKDPVGVPGDAATRHVLIGELGLDGSVRRVRGVLPLLLAARGHGRTTAIVPSDNLAEASLSGLLVRGADNLPQVLAFLRGDGPLVEADPSSMRPQATAGPADMADVLGQPEARAALELAAAGRHHIAMLGPPGAGKTMLAMRLVGLLPPLDDEQALQVTAIHSVAGALEDDHPLVVRPPFIGPHHSASLAAMVGGGSGLPRPGAASLAHHGVLFLDESRERTCTRGLQSFHGQPGRRRASPAGPSIRNKTYPPYLPYNVAVADGRRPIVLYLRLSKYHADGADAIDRQRLDLTRQLESDGGWSVVGEYVDNDSASASAVRSRAGWQALNKSIADGTVTAVAFWKLDRTNRVASKIIEWLATCRKSGVTLVSHEDPSAELNEASASAKLLIGIKSFSQKSKPTRCPIARRPQSATPPKQDSTTAACPLRVASRRPSHRLLRADRNPTRTSSDSNTRHCAMPFIESSTESRSTTLAGCGARSTASRPPLERKSQPATFAEYLTSPRLMGYRMRQVPEHKRGVRINLLDHIARDQHGEPVISQEPVCDRVTWMRLQSAIAGGPRAQRGAYGETWPRTRSA